MAARCRGLDINVDLDALRARLRKVTDDELIVFGMEMRNPPLDLQELFGHCPDSRPTPHRRHQPA